MIGESMIIVLAGLGVNILKTNDTPEKLTIWITVPKTSTKVDVNGNEMAGEFLAKRIKKNFTEMGMKRLELRYKVLDIDWDDQKGAEAEIEMKKTIFGSQW